MGRLCLLAIIIGWTQSADAFFCFTFGAGSGGGKRFYPYRNIAYPPPPIYFPFPNHPQAASAAEDLPPIRSRKPKPELIQGFRFRPLERGETGVIPSPPVSDRPH